MSITMKHGPLKLTTEQIYCSHVNQYRQACMQCGVKPADIRLDDSTNLCAECALPIVKNHSGQGDLQCH